MFRSCSLKTVRNNKGAILVFILIIYAVMLITSTVLLSTVVRANKMTQVNRKVRKAFSYAEFGLDEAYALTFEFIVGVGFHADPV